MQVWLTYLVEAAYSLRVSSRKSAVTFPLQALLDAEYPRVESKSGNAEVVGNRELVEPTPQSRYYLQRQSRHYLNLPAPSALLLACLQIGDRCVLSHKFKHHIPRTVRPHPPPLYVLPSITLQAALRVLGLLPAVLLPSLDPVKLEEAEEGDADTNWNPLKSLLLRVNRPGALVVALRISSWGRV